MNTFLMFIYVVSVGACAERIAHGLHRATARYTVQWTPEFETDSAVVVALCGFAVFPVINTLMVLTLWAFIVFKGRSK